MDRNTGETSTEVGSHASDSEPKARLVRWGFPAEMRAGRESLFVVAVVAPVLTLVYRLWDAHLRVPFTYRTDGLGTLAYIRSIIDNGWYFRNPRLGAPFVADWRDFPVGGENVHWVSLKIIGLVTGDPAATLNIYYLLSFFMIALAGYFVARYLRLGIASALVVGVLYAFAPFHAFHLIHVARSVYYLVPFALLVLLWAADYRHELLVTDEGGTRWRYGRIGTAIGAVVMLASSDTQNAAYLVTFLAAIALVHTVRDRTWRPLALVAVLGAITLGTLLVNNAPYLWMRHQHGPNPEVAARTLDQQDAFALRPSLLLLPAQGHRIPAFAELTDRATAAATNDGEGDGTALGLVGSVGLLASLGAVGVTALGGRVRSADGVLLARLGFLNLVAIVIGTVGGFSFLLALGGLTQYRTWNRVSIFIAYASLLAVGILLERSFTFLRHRLLRPRATAIIAVITVVLVVGGAFDQTTPKYIPDYAGIANRFNVDRHFFHTLERDLPRGAMVFQLPVAAFPEIGPIVNMEDYEQFTAYLHTDDLRWSYGGMKGRPDANWIRNVVACDSPTAVAQLAAVGFTGVVVDTTGFAHGATAFLAGAEPLVGAPRVRSDDGRLLYLDLTALRSRMDAEVLPSTRREWTNATLGRSTRWNDFSTRDARCPEPLRWAIEPTASVDLSRGHGVPTTADLATSIEANPQATHVTITGPGFSEVVPLTNGRGHFSRSVRLPRGQGRLRFTLAGPRFVSPSDQRTLWFALRNANFDAVGTPTLSEWAHRPTTAPG